MNKMSAIPDLNLSETITLNVKILEYLGYFPPIFRNSAHKLRFLLSVFMFVVMALLVCLVSEAAELILAFGDLEHMTNASYLFFSHITQASKLCVLVARNAEIWKMIFSLNCEEFKPSTLDQCEELRRTMAIARKISVMFAILGCGTCTLWMIFPFVEGRKENGKVRLPLSGWYPFSVENSPVFEMVFVYQSIAAYSGAVATITTDTLIVAIFMVISAQVQCLERNLESTANKRSALVEEMMRYNHILQFSDNVMKIFTPCLLVQLLFSAIIICVTLFQMSIISVFSIQFFSLVIYQSCIVLEIFMWCYVGNEVTFNSEKLTFAAINNNWIDASRAYKKDLLFFMTRCQFPLKLYIGGYFLMSLETFKAIGKSSWSYFAVLNEAHAE